MKTKKSSQREAHDEIKMEPLFNAQKTGFFPKAIKPFRMLIYATGLAGIGLLFNSCMAGYVASEPSYVEYSRPQRSNESQIWIGGDWNYNRQTHVYVQNNGYWENPRRGQTYTSGYWQTSPQGKSWTKGRWHSEKSKKNNLNR